MIFVSMFPFMVQDGNTVRAQSKKSPIASVTDNVGNTYTRVSSKEWESRNVYGGAVIVTVNCEAA